MQPGSYWITVAVFVSVFTVSAGNSPVAAGERLLSPDTASVGPSGVSTSVLTTATETNKSEPGKLDTPSIQGSAAHQPEKKEIHKGEIPDDVQALKTRVIDLQNKGKLGFRQIVRCRSVEGFGVYSPLEGGEQGPRMVFYCEPSNISAMISEGRYIIDCSVDAFIADSAGKVLLAREGVVKLNRVSRCPVMDLYFKIELGLQKLAGRTVFVKIVLNDKIKNQSVSALERVNTDGGKKVLDGI